MQRLIILVCFVILNLGCSSNRIVTIDKVSLNGADFEFLITFEYDSASLLLGVSKPLIQGTEYYRIAVSPYRGFPSTKILIYVNEKGDSVWIDGNNIDYGNFEIYYSISNSLFIDKYGTVGPFKSPINNNKLRHETATFPARSESIQLVKSIFYTDPDGR